jgi:hypothetical protein
MALMNVGELFKYLNSDRCNVFFQDYHFENKDETIDNMMNDHVFITAAHQYVSDDSVIRSKITSKMEQLLKKKTRRATPHELFLANMEGISKQLETAKEQHMNKRTLLVSAHETLLTKIKDIVIDEVIEEVIEEVIDEDKGKYIGSGIYLKRDGHLIKMTAPTFTIYY